MPITGPASYLPTTDLFIAHWNIANTELGAAGPIILAGTMTVAGLTALRTTLETRRAAVEAARNTQEGARATIEILKASLLIRLNQFNSKLPSIVPGSTWESMRPKAFSQSEGMGKVVPPLDDLSDLWNRYNVANPPLNLMEGYSSNDFDDELAALKAAYTAYAAAENGLAYARGKRNETQALIKPVLVLYRKRIPSEFAEGSAVVASLPAYSPPEGATPDAVELAGTYDAATDMADLAWSEVTDPTVTELELRATAGPEYDDEDETILATFAPGDPRVWTGNFGLLVPGAAASYKLYSITADGNERGSNAVTVTRPV
jgi:hypothetical protein